MSGIKLEELPASDMLDVLHYFFEDDTYYASEVAAETKNNLRVHLYKDMYEKPYKYASSRFKPKSRNFNAQGDSTEFYSPVDQGTKPFIPATEFNPDSINPFGDVLDRPFI